MADTQTIPLKSAADAKAGAVAGNNAVFALRLTPSNNSDQPVVANTTHVHLAPGMAYIDFGFVEPGVLAMLPRAAQQDSAIPREINGKLAVRVLMGFDGIAALHHQLGRVMQEVAKAAQQTKGPQNDSMQQ